MQEQKQPNGKPEGREAAHDIRQRFQNAIVLVRIIYRASEQDAMASQVEDALMKALEQLPLSAQTVQAFKDNLAKVRKSKSLTYQEDTYVMGGVLIYCGILLQVLMGLGVHDVSTKLALFSFAITFPCTVGFFLVRFLKEKSGVSRYGYIHSCIALFAEIGVIVTTSALIFHAWNIAGWAFLICSVVLFFGYWSYKFSISYLPFLGALRDILKNLSVAPAPASADIPKVTEEDENS